jgi:hypothetical protein
MCFLARCAAGDLSKERGAVLEEWRMARTATGRASEAHWKLIMQGSRWGTGGSWSSQLIRCYTNSMQDTAHLWLTASLGMF